MLRPFFSFYGGKWRDALKHYPAPEHARIVEPFAGSAGYALRYADRDVALCDIDPIVCGVWRYLTSVTPEEVLALPDLPEGGTVDDLKIPQEARWLVGFWLNKATSSPRKSASSWMRIGIRPGSFWGDRVRISIASQVEKIRHWKVIEGSYESILETRPATWFVDPPYQDAGKHYRFGAKSIDFAALGEWCRERVGQTIVCENLGATWLPFERLADVKTARRGKRSVEACWIAARAA